MGDKKKTTYKGFNKDLTCREFKYQEGEKSHASNTGDYSAASNTGNHSIAMASGKDSKAKAVVGSAIVLVYRDKYFKLIHIKSAIIDGKKLKADTYYSLNKVGEFVECNTKPTNKGG